MPKPIPCPCCGQPLPDFPVDFLAELTPGKAGEILRIVAENPGLTAPEIGDELYGSDPEGGPNWVSSSVSQLLRKARPKWHKHGWTVEGRKGHNGGYWLKKLNTDP